MYLGHGFGAGGTSFPEHQHSGAVPMRLPRPLRPMGRLNLAGDAVSQSILIPSTRGPARMIQLTPTIAAPAPASVQAPPVQVTNPAVQFISIATAQSNPAVWSAYLSAGGQ